jgi:hypothetical protein
VNPSHALVSAASIATCFVIAPSTVETAEGAPLMSGIREVTVTGGDPAIGIHITSKELGPLACPEALLPFDAEANPEITVLVYNNAPAPGDLLAAAKREADRIFSRAGVRVNWFDCSEGRPDVRGVCHEGWGDTNIGLRVVATPVAKPRRSPHVIDHRQEEPLGFVVFPGLASVYYDYRARFAGDELALGLPMILGCAIAHELGHLLLGPNRHSDEGIMQPEWSPRQFRLARMRELSFTQEESCVIRTAARKRMPASPDRQR